MEQSHAVLHEESSAGMGPELDMTPAEIGRSLTRIEAAVTSLSAQMQSALSPIGVHGKAIENLERRADDVEDDVKTVTKDANRIAGAGAILAILAGIVPWPWRK